MGQPKYIRIKDRILSDIRSGKVSPGEKLPTREELTAQFSVTRTTIDKALGELRRCHAIRTSRRAGTFVAYGIDPIKVGIVSRLSPPANPSYSKEYAGTLQGMFSTIVLRGKHFDMKFLDDDEVLSSSRSIQNFEVVVWVQPDNQTLEKLSKMNDRIIVTNRYSPHINFVSTNHRQAIKEVTSHFADIADKNSQLFFLDTRSNGFVDSERREGFIAACEEHGRFYRICPMARSFGDNLLLLESLPIDSKRQVIMVSPNMQFTGAVLKMAGSRGLELGKNFFYSDFDNAMSVQNHGVQVTTVIQNYKQMGNTLIDAIWKFNKSKIQEFIPHRIIFG